MATRLALPRPRLALPRPRLALPRPRLALPRPRLALPRPRLALTRPRLATATTAARRQGALVAHARRLHLPSAVLPPLIFSGLFVALWCWKCTMLVLLQNAIIYNPFIPPNARSMRIADFARQCGGVEWREERIRSLDGTSLALCVSDMPSSPARTAVYILYFQGNASSLPPRLPDISAVLRHLTDAATGADADEPTQYTTVCLSYRGYWTSHDRPSEGGINMDAEAALRWISQLHRDRASAHQLPEPVVVLWGQSIGCGFATNLAATPSRPSDLSIDALVLETPFTNTRAMLQALYPQRWLPYQHLWPFLRNHLDSWKNLGTIAGKQQLRPPDVYIVEAAKDELVPRDHGAMLQRRCHDVGLRAHRHTVRGALHNGVMVRHEGRRALAQSIRTAVARARGRKQHERELCTCTNTRPQARKPG